MKVIGREELDGIRRALNSTHAGAPVKWREHGFALLDEVERLMASRQHLLDVLERYAGLLERSEDREDAAAEIRAVIDEANR